MRRGKKPMQRIFGHHREYIRALMIVKGIDNTMISASLRISVAQLHNVLNGRRGMSLEQQKELLSFVLQSPSAHFLHPPYPSWRQNVEFNVTDTDKMENLDASSNK